MTPRELHDERWRVAILMFACMLLMYGLDAMLVHAVDRATTQLNHHVDGGTK